ncbi:transcription termination factor Rho [Petralouisia muris]|jgi:transcription termination factor Rho|uniref:Transcription termination factor Rho n=1 Tax=Petralouisia muris TaxID=3032872 RepID=A0AC61S0B8_9FIRM|nr:transcription termination factor Rho [Petralouisia muris]TGY97618.1 transcription termination factor Rho [Petralouisia muris]
MREKYESLSVTVLKEVAKARGLRHLSGLKKSELVELMLQEDEKSSGEEKDEKPEVKRDQPAEKRRIQPAGNRKEERKSQSSEDKREERKSQNSEDKREERKSQSSEDKREERKSQNSEDKREEQRLQAAEDRREERRMQNPERKPNRIITADGIEIDNPELDSGVSAHGILEVMPDGYGFIRCENYLPGDHDVYVSPSQIRKFGLKTGDIIHGNTRVKTQQEKFSALLYIKSINGNHPSEILKRPNFEDLTPIFPNERIRLETDRTAVAMRIMDIVSPIGKGQRGMIVSQPKAGKTTLLKQVAKAVTRNHPEMHLIILLIDERPEEVTDIKEAIEGKNVEVIYSTFDELPEHHKRVSEMVIERARRLVEHGKDVMILLDSITRLARAYNLIVPPSGRTLSGGIDPAALHMPKRFFGAARNMREGGSITILATALVDTGSRMDDVIYEEFKGTGNMELILDRKLSERRIFPAVDITGSGTRREDLLLNREEQEAVEVMRRAINGMKTDEAVESILNLFVRTNNNREFCQMVKKTKLS